MPIRRPWAAVVLAVALSVAWILPARADEGHAGNHRPSPSVESAGGQVGPLAPGEPVYWHTPVLVSSGRRPGAGDLVLCQTVLVAYTCAWPGNFGLNPDQLAADQASMQAENDALCGVAWQCIRYELDVEAADDAPPQLLRVGIRQQSYRDKIASYLYAPDGTFAGKLHAGATSEELSITAPTVGTWVVHVVAYDALDTSVQFRAALDPVPPADRSVTESLDLLPNLQMTPPSELGFGPCHQNEVVEYEATRCLRFDVGPANVGAGPLDLFTSDVTAGDLVEGVMYQRIHQRGTADDPDPEPRVVPAGAFVYHEAHQHVHHAAFGTLDLYAIDPTGRSMTRVGEGPKQGFCFGEYRVADWDSFTAGTPGEAYGDEVSCTDVPLPPGTPIRMGLADGWVDIYSWYLEGNYVDFGTNGPGLYAIVVGANERQADGSPSIVESDYGDNVAYVYLRVCEGGGIAVIERGQGSGPFDPHRRVVDDFVRPVRWEADPAPACTAGP